MERERGRKILGGKFLEVGFAPLDQRDSRKGLRSEGIDPLTTLQVAVTPGRTLSQVFARSKTFEVR